MNEYVMYTLAATIGTWFVTALGAASVVFFKKTSRKAMNVMLGFASGVMIAASFWSLLQPAVERAESLGRFPPYIVTTTGFLAGALFMWLSDRIVTGAREKAELCTDDGKTGMNRVIMLVLSITLHNIPEGLAVGAAFGALAGNAADSESIMGAVTVAVGIGLQNFPEGAAVSLPLRREGFSRRKSFLIGQASGMAEPAAGVIGCLAILYIESILPFALSFAAGTMILVAVHELIPECQGSREVHPYFSTMGIISGFAVMMLLDVMLG